MAHSMTAFARNSTIETWGQVTWECRGVNHRYLELSIKVPEPFRCLEPQIRTLVAQHLNRGKVECWLRFQPAAALQPELSANESLLKKLLVCERAFVDLDHTTRPMATAFDWLRWPDAIQVAEQDLSSIHSPILQTLSATLDDLVDMRAREGERLVQVISAQLEKVELAVQAISEAVPELLKAQRQKWHDRLAEFKETLDTDRLEQEMLYLAQRSDVQEELDRLQSHVNEARQALALEEPIGRRLDFLMQEFNREANTIASKSMSQRVTQQAVDLKVCIEQMREQIQNIE